MLDPSYHAKRNILLTALLLICISFLILLFYRGFMDPDEGRYSEIPREMVASGHEMEMRLLGYRYYEKPPLAYWMVVPAIKFLGAYDWAVRVPLLINALLIISLAYLLVRKTWPGTQGGLSLLFACASMGWLIGLGLLMTDPFLVLWFNLTVIALYWAFQADIHPRKKLLLILLAAVAAVLGFLTKGAVAIVLPCAIIGLWLLWEKKFSALWTPSVILAGLVFILLLTPVLLLIEEHNPGFLRHFIYEEHLARFTGTRRIQVHKEPFWFFLKILPLLLLPWSLFIFRAVRTMVVKKVFAAESLSRFLLVWFVVVFVFFSASTGKLMSYILPGFLPCVLLVARWGILEPQDGTAGDRRLWHLGLAGLLITQTAAIITWLLSFSRIIPDVIYPVSWISILALIPVTVMLVYLLYVRHRARFPELILAGSGTVLTLALLISPLAGKEFNVLLHRNSSYVYKHLAATLKPDDRIVVFWSYRPALAFYTRRLYIPFQDRNELAYGMDLEPDLPRELQHPDEVRRMFRDKPGRIFGLIEPGKFKEKFKSLGLRYKPTDLPSDPDTIIVEILPPQ